MLLLQAQKETTETSGINQICKNCSRQLIYKQDTMGAAKESTMGVAKESTKGAAKESNMGASKKSLRQKVTDNQSCPLQFN